MKRTVSATLNLFVRLSLIVAFGSYTVVPAFARTPPNDSTASKNSPLREHSTRTKSVDLTNQHSVKPLKNLEQLRIIEFKVAPTNVKSNKRSLTAQEMKAVKGALSKVIARESLSDDLRQLKIIDLNTLSAGSEFSTRSLSPKQMKALKSAVKAAKGCTILVEEGGWWSCMKGCLADVGVSPYSLIICGATCVAGAIPICALCVGVSVAVMEACAVGCVLYND